MADGEAITGELVFVGLGLGDQGPSLGALEAIRESEAAYVDNYTSPPSPQVLKIVEEQTKRRLVEVGREFVEDGKEILERSKDSKVVLAVQGDPMIATTHNDLRARAASRGIQTRVVYGATVAAAAASASGLHYYKFGGTITFTMESASLHQEVYHRVHRNLLAGQHTLILLEFDLVKQKGAEPGFVIERLLEAERNFKREVVSEKSLVLVLSRLGREDEGASGGSMGRLKLEAFGKAPHCVVVPGKLHFSEEEVLEAVLRVPKGEVADNAAGVRRTAEVLIPKYVEKAKRALDDAKTQLGDRHKVLLENAELYLKDSEGFLANGQDELAMLSVGYAEGLIDALAFIGEIRLSW